VRWRIT
jgi:hypothetical protein